VLRQSEVLRNLAVGSRGQNSRELRGREAEEAFLLLQFCWTLRTKALLPSLSLLMGKRSVFVKGISKRSCDFHNKCPETEWPSNTESSSSSSAGFKCGMHSGHRLVPFRMVLRQITLYASSLSFGSCL
jgi:hypothetical protein